MKNRLLLIISAAFFLFTDCSKDKVTDSDLKLSKIYSGNQLQNEFSYNSSGQLSKSVIYGFQSRKAAEYNLFYDGSGKLVKRETAFDVASGPNPQWSYSYTDYSYSSDGRINEEKNYNQQNNVYVLVSKVKPGYNGSGKMISRTMYTPNDVLARLTKYEYNNDGNIIVQEDYQYNGSTPNLQYRYSYDNFDNKLNPHLNLASAVPPFSVNKNNILKTTVTNYVVTPGTPVTTTSYTVYNSYNNSGFPIKMLENGTEFTHEYQ